MVSVTNSVACAAAGARAVSSRVRSLVALGALVCAMTLSALPARAEGPGGLNCLSERQATKTQEEYAKLLSPAEGATLPASTPVTFFARGGGEWPMTFMVASSPALLSSPDIDSGLGTLLPPGYKTELVPPEENPEWWLTSTKASATPRTIYWTASFTHNLRSCDEPPVTFTLPRAHAHGRPLARGRTGSRQAETGSRSGRSQEEKGSRSGRPPAASRSSDPRSPYSAAVRQQ